MPSDRQKSEWLKANSTEGWRDLFEHTSSRGVRHRCKVCGQTGYLHGEAAPAPYSWAVSHLMGHSPCPTCGKQFTAAGMNHHIAKMHGKEDDR
jgi:hypothetical protein